MNQLIEISMLFVLIIQFILLIALFFRSKKESQENILERLDEYDKKLDRYEQNIRDEFSRNREENNKSAKEARDELSASLRAVEEKLSTTITNFTTLVDNKIKSILDTLELSSKANREELVNSLKSFEEKFTTKIENLTKETQESLEKNRITVEKKLSEIQESNERKLEKMRETVDEKLQKTLEFRLGESFKLVSERLELVQKGLGEMQSLASDVGDLKKVMSNVKTKGVLGEYQLESILEQMLSPNQYEKNVITKLGSNDRVEFAIKIPSKEDSERIIWLPIDAKLPTADYEILLDAYEKGDKETIEESRKSFYRTIKIFAKKINDKYIDSPNTTDFAILFLPFEGAYAEVVRDPGLYEGIQREFKIIVTGPSTIAAFLNALQIGFKSLAVEKGTSAILSALGAAKKEFGTFETILLKVKEQIEKASVTLDETVGRRTRAINRVLRNIESSSDDLEGQKLFEEE
ncbi:MAG: DNA recombination protein RmuC [Candidatus Cloacimonetes bacterium]|nr:DNA recombination protein RmuC [Candidatus Cloacimonadota bacterium]